MNLASPEHKIHKLKPFSSEESLPIGWQHQAGAEGIKEVLHHFLLLSRGRVVTFEYLRGEAKGRKLGQLYSWWMKGNS